MTIQSPSNSHLSCRRKPRLRRAPDFFSVRSLGPRLIHSSQTTHQLDLLSASLYILDIASRGQRGVLGCGWKRKRRMRETLALLPRGRPFLTSPGNAGKKPGTITVTHHPHTPFFHPPFHNTLHDPRRHSGLRTKGKTGRQHATTSRISIVEGPSRLRSTPLPPWARRDSGF